MAISYFVLPLIVTILVERAINEELGEPESGLGQVLAPLGTKGRKSVLLKLTLHDCNKTSSSEFLY